MSSFKRIGVNLRLCMSVSGTSRHFVAMRNLVVIGAWRTSTKPHQSSSIYRVRGWPSTRSAGYVKSVGDTTAQHPVPDLGPRTTLRAGGKLLSTVNAICPVQPSFQKIIRFRRRANQFYQLAPSFPCKRGVSRSSRTREGMRWTRQRRRASAFTGRVSRRQPCQARRTNGAGVRTAKPCGPDTRCWCQASRW